MKNDEALIKCENVCISYGGTNILENVNFTVANGDYLCIVGQNGSGKSTLVKALLSLKAPSAGKITYEGCTAKDIGYLPQQTSIKRDFPATVSEVVLSGTLSHSRLPFYRAEDKKKARENMEKLGIENLSKRCFRELSGGQRQRVLLARAMCSADKLLLLDEPVAGLDPLATREMYRATSELNKSGMTVIMVSHDFGAVLRYGTKILHLDKSVLFFGKREDYVKSRVFETFETSEAETEND